MNTKSIDNIEGIVNGDDNKTFNIPFMRDVFGNEINVPFIGYKFQTPHNISKKRIITIGGLYALIAIVSLIGLYVDYKCESELVIPKQYICLSEHDSDLSIVDLHDPMYSEKIGFSRRSTNTDNMIEIKNIIKTINDSHIFDNISDETNFNCISDNDCGNGKCELTKDVFGNITGSDCKCKNGYLTTSSTSYCNYKQLSGLILLLISIFVGGCGIDRCVVARGNGCCICLGILKGITIGGLGIWWIVDIILFGLEKIKDGNGYELTKIL